MFIITNHSFMLYKFRKELIRELLKKHQITLVMPANEFTQEFQEIGCKIIDIDVDRRGINPIIDYKLYKKYKNLIEKNRPDMILTYSIKPNIYAGIAAKKLGIQYCSNITGLGTAFQKPFLAQFVTVLYKIAFSKVKTVFFENESNMNLFLEN
ncbi:glycosyltransferase [Thomasclavelia cocleata]|uniref:glycosyltransferase n=1 Tax=Thomasclavelia cocleata TaxID=69824 RepID=UPI00242FB1D6|nr:glycosyltransferase [Thomasclavelia cocleata]